MYRYILLLNIVLISIANWDNGVILAVDIESK